MGNEFLHVQIRKDPQMKTAALSSWQITTLILCVAALVTALLSSPPSGTCPRPATGDQLCVYAALKAPMTVAGTVSMPSPNSHQD
jgi:hypothetical protein